MISIGRLVEILGVTDEADVALLTQQRDAALAFIESQTSAYFGPAVSTTRYVNGSGSGRLYLSEPVTSITSVTEYNTPGVAGDEVVATTGYVLRNATAEAYLIRVGSGAVWTAGYEYALTYTRGYAEDGLPKDIENVLIELIKLARANIGREGINSETIGGYSYSKPATYAFDDGDLKQIPGAYQTILAWRRLVCV